MSRRDQLEPVFVDTMPERLEEGHLYISKRYRTAMHLCCCGCGLEVVTPLNPAKWRLTEHGATVSLFPSVGNWGFPCQSHYVIERDRVRWAMGMSAKQIESVRHRDRAAVVTMGNLAPPKTTRPPAQLKGWWRRFAAWLGEHQADRVVTVVEGARRLWPPSQQASHPST